MLKADLHIHTKEDPFEPFIKHTAKDLVNYCEKLKFDVLCIANHKSVFYNREIADYAKKRNILLIPGAEAEIEGKHILLLNFKKKKLPSTFDEIRKLRKENVVVIAVHPFFYPKYSLREKLLKNKELFDAIEYSHYYTKLINYNKKAEKIAKSLKLPLLGSSDAHNLWQINDTYSLIDAEKNINSVLNAIRNKKTALKTKPLSIIKFSRITFSIFYWSLKNCLRKIYKEKTQ